MPHYLTPRYSKHWSNRFLLFLVITFFQTGILSSQCMMIPLSLDNQAAKSDLIVEGVVKEKSAFINAAGNFIYTTYQIEITKIFKGQLHTSMVQVVELGGQVGNRGVEVSPSIKLTEGESGTYFLEQYTFRDPQDGQRFSAPVYRAYASSQSVFQYDFYNNTVSGYFNQYAFEDWYDVLTNATRTGYKQVKELTLPERNNSRMAPTISNMSPLNITAGTFSVLTITGNGFGATQGTSTVEFKNADDGGGTWFAASAVHTLTWSNTQITIRVPYSGGSGQVRVTVAGMAVISSQSLAIAYNQYSVEFNLPPATLVGSPGTELEFAL